MISRRAQLAFPILILCSILVGAIVVALVITFSSPCDRPLRPCNAAEVEKACRGVLSSYCEHNDLQPCVFGKPVVKQISIAPRGKPGKLFTYATGRPPHRTVVILWDEECCRADIVEVR